MEERAGALKSRQSCTGVLLWFWQAVWAWANVLGSLSSVLLSCQTGISPLNKYVSACFVQAPCWCWGYNKEYNRQDSCPHSTNDYILEKVVRKGLWGSDIWAETYRQRGRRVLLIQTWGGTSSVSISWKLASRVSPSFNEIPSWPVSTLKTENCWPETPSAVSACVQLLSTLWGFLCVRKDASRESGTLYGDFPELSYTLLIFIVIHTFRWQMWGVFVGFL